MIRLLSFRSLPILSNPHFQTILGSKIPAGKSPPSKPWVVTLKDGDSLCCEVSTPTTWKTSHKTVLLIHGLGGCHSSKYMIRISRKLYQAGYKVVRINLRGCGSGRGLATRPYHAGKSDDVLQVIHALKNEATDSPIVLIGFSLGGNIALKLAGELGKNSEQLVHSTIAVCPPLDLRDSISMLSLPSNRIYQRLYLKELQNYAYLMTGTQPIRSIADYDSCVTVPHWGYRDSSDFYDQSSSRFFISHIQHPCHILFSMDDPFISYRPALEKKLPSHIKIWISQNGGHMGFLKWSGRKHQFFWLDHLLLNWIEES